MTWGNPMAGWGFLILGCLGIAWWVLGRYHKRQRRHFVSDTMYTRISTQDTRQQSWRIGLWAVGVSCLIVAAMQPRYGYVLEDRPTNTRAIILAIDVSKSMAAEDILPSRFEIARQHMLATLAAFPESPMGLIVFAGEAYLQCPLTTDHDAVRSYIQELYPGFLPVQGTNLAAVLRVADDLEKTIRGPFDVFLFSDGEALSGDTHSYLSPLAKRGIRFYTIGIGRPAGEPIPLRDAQGKITEHKQDTEGKIVLSKLDEKTLTNIAENTGGRYISSPDTRAIDRLLSVIESEKSKDAHAAQIRHYNEWYMIPLSLGLFLLALQWILPAKHRPGRHKGIGLLILIGTMVLPNTLAAASAKDLWHYHQGKTAYENRDYPKAAAELSKVSDQNAGQHYYNLGNTAYQANAIEEAAAYYENAAPYLTTVAEKAWLTYNQGNTAFRQGKFKEAAAFYRQSLTHNPSDKEAKINLELALKKMKEQQSPPPQQKPEPPKPPQNDQKERKKQQKQSEASQTLKTLRQKEQFNTMPPTTKVKSTEKDW